MKTSQKILVAFFSIIALFHLSLLFEVEKPDFYETHSTKEFTPASFSHLKLKDEVVLFVKKDTTRNHLKYHYLNDSEPDTAFFLVRNDTLIVSKPELKGKNEAVFLESGNIKSITSINSHLRIQDKPLKDMLIKSRNSQIKITNTDSLQNLNISLKDKSRMTVEATHLKIANIDMTNSRADLNTDIETLNADIKKNSNLRVKHIIHSNIQNDGSCRFSTRRD